MATTASLFSLEEVLPHAHSPLRTVASLPPSHLLASSSDGQVVLYGPNESILQPDVFYDPPPTKKPIDKLIVLHAVGKIIVLSEGVLSFHGIPNMEILPAGAAGGAVNISNLVKGVSAFAVDDPSRSVVHLAIAKRKTLSFYKVTQHSVDAVRDLPLPQPVYSAIFRKNAVCVADRQSYSIIDIIAGDQIPLLPISQESAAEAGPASALAAPSIVAVGSSEFLVASHTTTGSMGLFVRHTGDPCRGTINWSSRVRSLAVEGAPSDRSNVDHGFVLALLRNNTIEVHSLSNTERATQIITLQPEVVRDPRLLVALPEQGLDFTGTSQSTIGGSLDYAKVSLLTSLDVAAVPSTPPSRPRRTSSLRSRRALAPAHTLLQCKQSLFAIQPLTLLVQAEALLDAGRAKEAVALAEASQRSETTRYIYFRAAMLHLADTNFAEAGECFVMAMRRRGVETQKSVVLDPRLILRMWPDLRGDMRKGDAPESERVDIWRGAEDAVKEMEKTIDALVLANLYRNYSPHVKPDIEHAPSTVELRRQLTSSARSMTMRVLREWRAEREQGSTGSRRLDKVVDTALAKLLVEDGDTESMLALLLVKPSNVLVEDLILWLQQHKHEAALARVYLTQDRAADAVPIFIRLYDATVPPASPPMTLTEIESLVSSVTEAALRQQYALWFLSRHRSTGIKLLASLPSETGIATRDLLEAVRQHDAKAAQELAESYVLLKKSADPELQTSIILRYVELMAQSQASQRSFLNALEREYTSQAKNRSHISSSFLHFLQDKKTGTPILDIRLRLILFLHASPDYDAQQIRERLEKMPGTAFELTMVYGRLKLHRQALAILTLTLGDLQSAEAYCANRGALMSSYQAQRLGESLDLPMEPVKISRRRAMRTTLDAERTELVKMLIDLCLQHRDKDSVITRDTTIQLISTQAMHLDLGDILLRTPDTWLTSELEPFCTRALRRTLDQRYELQVIKALASGHNLLVSDEAFSLLKESGPYSADDGAMPTEVVEPEISTALANKLADLAIDKHEKEGDDML